MQLLVDITDAGEVTRVQIAHASQVAPFVYEHAAGESGPPLPLPPEMASIAKWAAETFKPHRMHFANQIAIRVLAEHGGAL